MPRVKYRADIEGLRALAIVLVVADHAGLPGFAGGFVGVDIFFVISGYLITGLLLAEYRDTGRIAFASFYARRFRRLLPALLLMMATTAIAAWMLLPPSGQAYQAMAGAAASTWMSNLYFAFEHVDYFGAAAESNIYLHTWSLGVEEQFYLAWPLLIAMLLRHRHGGASGGTAIAIAMPVLLLAGWVACAWLTQVSAKYAFYLMPARAWQFAAGAVACLYGPRLLDRLRALHAHAHEAMGATGVALVVLALFFVSARSAYPGAWAVLPTMGAVCLLLAGTGQRSMATRALAVAPMQWTGRLSYAWYLWHWPVLVLGALVLPAPGLPGRLALALGSLLLAAASFAMVERPLRRNEDLVRVPSQFILASLLLMAVAAFLFVRWSDAARAQVAASASMASKADPLAVQFPAIYAMGCDDWYRSDRLKPCVFGEDSAPRTAVVVGDSIGLQWFPAYQKVFSAPEWRLVVLTKSSCPMVERPIFNARIGREFVECATWRTRALDYITHLGPDVVVMGTTHSASFSKDDWIEGTNDVLARVAPASREVFIMRSTPVLPFNGPGCLAARKDVLRATGAGNPCRAEVHDELNDDVAGWLSTAATRWSNVRLIDLNGEVCPDGICNAVQDGSLVYRDEQHLNAGFVVSLAEALQHEMLGPGTSRRESGRKTRD